MGDLHCPLSNHWPGVLRERLGVSNTMKEGRVVVGTTDRPQHMPGHLSLTVGVHVLVFSGVSVSFL